MLKLSGNPTVPVKKMEIKLVYTEGDVFEDTKIMSAELNCSMFQLATMGRRNHFHIFLSLTVNCENKLLKLYFVPRL